MNGVSPIECPSCGYDQRGLPSTHRCPECGLRFGAGAMVWKQPSEPCGLRAGKLLLLALFVVAWFWRASLAQAFWGATMAGRAMSVTSAALSGFGVLAFLLIIIHGWLAGFNRAFVILTDLDVTFRNGQEHRLIHLREIASVETRRVGRRTFVKLKTRGALQLDLSAALGFRAAEFQREMETRIANLQPAMAPQMRHPPFRETY